MNSRKELQDGNLHERALELLDRDNVGPKLHLHRPRRFQQMSKTTRNVIKNFIIEYDDE